MLKIFHSQVTLAYNYLCNRIRRLLLPILLRRARRIYPSIHPSVRFVTSSVVVKTHSTISIDLETEALRFVKSQTSIPVPDVYDVVHDADGRRSQLFMQFVDGKMLGKVWRDITPEQRLAVVRAIHGFILQLRAIRQPSQPPGWIGSPEGRHCFDMRVSSSPYGPFPTETEYNDWRISTFSWFGSVNEQARLQVQGLRQRMRGDHRIFFTHGDITPRNVLVKVHGSRAEDIEIVALLDWEQAGWRPEFWEASKVEFSSQDYWCELLKQEIFPGFEDELSIENTLSSISGPLPA